MVEAVPQNKKSGYSLDALRGFAAICVMLYHIVFYGKYLDPGYLPESFKYFYDESIFAVLIFFVISGTVISLNYKKNLTLGSTGTYLKKRFRRIYPIYFISLVFTLLISKAHYSFPTIAANFSFLQVLFTGVILENGPIWSLHYEILFYLLFIPISMYRINPLVVAASALLVGLVNYFLFPYTNS